MNEVGIGLGISLGLMLVTAAVLPTFMAFAAPGESKAQTVFEGKTYVVTAKSTETEVTRLVVDNSNYYDGCVSVYFSDPGEVDLTVPLIGVDYVDAVGVNNIPFQTLSSDAKSTTIRFTVPEGGKEIVICGDVNIGVLPSDSSEVQTSTPSVEFKEVICEQVKPSPDGNTYKVSARSSGTVKCPVIWPDDFYLEVEFSEPGPVELTVPITGISRIIEDNKDIPFFMTTPCSDTTCTIKFTVPEGGKKIGVQGTAVWPSSPAKVPMLVESKAEYMEEIWEYDNLGRPTKMTERHFYEVTARSGGTEITGVGADNLRTACYLWMDFSKPGPVEVTLPVTNLNTTASSLTGPFKIVRSDAKSTTVSFTVVEIFGGRPQFGGYWGCGPNTTWWPYKIEKVGPIEVPAKVPMLVESKAEYMEEIWEYDNLGRPTKMTERHFYEVTARSGGTEITEFGVAPTDDCYLDMDFSKPGPVELTLPMTDMTNFRIWSKVGDIPFKIVSSDAKSTTIIFTVPDTLGIGGSGCGTDGTTMWPYKIEKVGPAGCGEETPMNVALKHKKKVTLVAVKNICDEGIFGVLIEMDGGSIKFVTARGWDRDRIDQSTIILQTTNRPIELNKSLIILLIVDNQSSSFEFTAFDISNNIIGTSSNVMAK